MARRIAKKRKKAPDTEIQAKILKASLEAFAENGFEGTSVRDIANRVGVAHGLLRYYFGDKTGLWRAAVEFMFAQLGKEVFGVSDRDVKPPVEAAEFLRSYIRYCARNPEHARIMTQENIKGSDRFNWMADKFIRLTHDHVRMKLGARGEEWGFSSEQKVLFGYSIMAACQAISLYSAEIARVYKIDTTAASIIEAHAETVMTLYTGANSKPASN